MTLPLCLLETFLYIWTPHQQPRMFLHQPHVTNRAADGFYTEVHRFFPLQFSNGAFAILTHL